ncbi:hypothetical protein STEG23_002746 [Scotinomys teguina]
MSWETQFTRGSERNQIHQMGTMEDKRRKQIMSHRRRAQLQFSESIVNRSLQEENFLQSLRASPSTFPPALVTSVLETLTSNILKLIGKEAQASGKKLISSEHVSQVLHNNKELHQSIKDDNESVLDKTPEPDKN